MYDVVWVLIEVVFVLNEVDFMVLVFYSWVFCDKVVFWEFGVDLLGYMKSVSFCFKRFNFENLFYCILFGLDYVMFLFVGFFVLYVKELMDNF